MCVRHGWHPHWWYKPQYQNLTTSKGLCSFHAEDIKSRGRAASDGTGTPDADAHAHAEPLRRGTIARAARRPHHLAEKGSTAWPPALSSSSLLRSRLTRTLHAPASTPPLALPPPRAQRLCASSVVDRLASVVRQKLSFEKLQLISPPGVAAFEARDVRPEPDSKVHRQLKGTFNLRACA